MGHTERDTSRRGEDDQQPRLSQSARKALRERGPARHERTAEGDVRVDEKGNIIPPRYEEGGVAGSTNETWEAGKPRSQAKVHPEGPPEPNAPSMEAE